MTITVTRKGDNLCIEADPWDVVEAMDGHDDDRTRASRGSNNHWAHSTLAQARKYVRVGWESGTAQITGRDPRYSVLDVESREFALLDEGSEPDVGAFLNGEEHSMGDWIDAVLPKPLVRIAVDIGISSAVQVEQKLRVGRSVLMCIETLRASGYPTEVDVVETVDHWSCSGTTTTVIHVQKADRPVHAALLAFYVAHPSAMRRAVFALQEELPVVDREARGFMNGYGYGRIISGHKAAYDEWAPSAQNPQAVEAWAVDVIRRRMQ